MQEIMYQEMGPFAVVAWLVIAAVIVIPFWKICARVGFTPWLSLLVLIPIANLVFIYFLAFSPWPARESS